MLLSFSLDVLILILSSKNVYARKIIKKIKSEIVGSSHKRLFLVLKDKKLILGNSCKQRICVAFQERKQQSKCIYAFTWFLGFCFGHFVSLS